MTRADTFEDLRCWQLAYKLKGEIKTKVIPCLPDSEKYELRSQILRASRSTTANIAEGWGRFHFLESNKFYYYSRGSLSELLDHLIEAKDSGFIEEEVYSEIRSLILESIKVLNGFIYYLKRENQKNK